MPFLCPFPCSAQTYATGLQSSALRCLDARWIQCGMSLKTPWSQACHEGCDKTCQGRRSTNKAICFSKENQKKPFWAQGNPLQDILWWGASQRLSVKDDPFKQARREGVKAWGQRNWLLVELCRATAQCQSRIHLLGVYLAFMSSLHQLTG